MAPITSLALVLLALWPTLLSIGGDVRSRRTLSVSFRAPQSTSITDPGVSGQTLGGITAQPSMNVLLIVLDDVGIDALECYDDINRAEAGFGPGMSDHEAPEGSRRGYAHTPTITGLALDGVRFSRCTSQPSCSPTRATIQSGRYGFRTGVGSVIRRSHVGENGFLEFSSPPAANELTLPELFDGGDEYEVALIGKHHLGLPLAENGVGPTHPNFIGWPVFKGTLHNLDHGVPHALLGFDPGYYNFMWIENGVETHTVASYATAYECQAAEDWIESVGDAPWFCTLALHACHAPWGPAQGGIRPFSGLYPPDPDATTWSGAAAYSDPEDLWDCFRAGLEAVDRELAALLSSLGDELEHTTVILVGDNGSSSLVFERALERGEDIGEPYASVIADRRLKGSVFEGGTRVPLIVRGPDVASPGRTSDASVDTVDLFATIAELTESDTTTTVDGRSFVSVLASASGVGARDFSYREIFTPNGAPADAELWERAISMRVQDGRHLKLIRTIDAALGTFDELYDLDVDPYERAPLDLIANNVALALLEQRLLEIEL